VAATALLGWASPALAVCGAPTITGSTATVTCPAGLSGRVSVPDHVGGVKIVAFGASGGTTTLQPFSGAGGSAQGTLNQAGAFELTVVVGSAGADGSAGGVGGAPGGGDGSGGGGGGGYSSVTDASGTVLMTVGGGGGSGGSNGPFGAGGDGAGGNSSFYPDGRPGGACLSPPASACPTDFVDGGGATTTAPGAGDDHPSVIGAIAGHSGQGASGGDAGAGSGGGGGGGGCFGGGGGGTDKNGPADGGGGGGGGSTCVDASLANVTNPPANGGDGVVTVTYTLPGGTKSVGGGFVDPGGAAGPPVMTLANGDLGVQLGCTGAKGTSCKGKVAATVRERLRGSKVIGVAARMKTVKVGFANYKIAANRVKVISVALNKRGRRLLRRFHRLKLRVTVAVTTSNGLKQAAVKTVTLRQKHKR
jgi:hypothetical protein